MHNLEKQVVLPTVADPRAVSFNVLVFLIQIYKKNSKFIHY